MSSEIPPVTCNPLPLEHYQRGRVCLRPRYAGPDFREMADPTVIRFQGRWYLFPSAGMLWHSDDMVDWTHHPVQPFDPGYAPTVVVKGDWLYLSASWDGSAIWRARHPFGPWEKLGREGRDADNNPTWLRDHEGQPVRWGDPCLFVDDDGAMYCYCNLARPARPEDHHPWNVIPQEGAIFGVRLRDDDPTRFAEAPRQLVQFDPARRWECMGAHNQCLAHPVLEGAWMTRLQGRYYLQYSANGTQFRNYAIGCCVGDSPLGEFVPQRRNPILIAGPGFVNGCAHHSMVEGPDGTLWCFYTTLVRIHHGLERRIGMDPAGLDANGELVVAGPTETPQYAPGVASDPLARNDLGLVPLSVDCPASASSALEGREPMYAFDNAIRTWWQASGALPQWLDVELEGEYVVYSARTLFADVGLDYDRGVVPGPYAYRILGALANGDWVLLCDRSANTREQHIAFDTWAPRKLSRVRLAILAVPAGMAPAAWEFTVFGLPQWAADLQTTHRDPTVSRHPTSTSRDP